MSTSPPPRVGAIIPLPQYEGEAPPSLGNRLLNDVNELLATAEAVRSTLNTIQEQNSLIRQLDRTILESTYSANRVLEQIITEVPSKGV
jgi:hypothetical protein